MYSHSKKIPFSNALSSSSSSDLNLSEPIVQAHPWCPGNNRILDTPLELCTLHYLSSIISNWSVATRFNLLVSCVLSTTLSSIVSFSLECTRFNLLGSCVLSITLSFIISFSYDCVILMKRVSVRVVCALHHSPLFFFPVSPCLFSLCLLPCNEKILTVGLYA